MDIKEKLSLLWIFALFNYIYADILSIYEPGIVEELITGSLGGIEFTQELLLGAAVLMETAILMVVLSRVLEYRFNRLANIVFGAVHTASVFTSLFVGTKPAPFYLFFSAIEMATTLLIIYLAWTWKPT